MKINQKLAKQIMALLVIPILLIPGLIMYEAEKQTINRVLTYKGLYSDGTIINVKPINKTEVEISYLNENIIGSDLNNDSYVYADDNIIKELYYGNWITYVGNGTYQVNYDKNSPPFTITALEWNLGIPLDINGSTLSKFDFVRITLTGQDFNHPFFFGYWFWPPYFEIIERYPHDMDKNKFPNINEKIYVLHYVEKNELTKMFNILGYEYDLYGKFQSVPYIPESKDFGDGNFTFKIEAFNFNENHTVFWNEEKLLYLSLGFTASILTIGTVFSTVQIDIKTGNRKIKRRNK